jgi:hypothetical protein
MKKWMLLSAIAIVVLSVPAACLFIESASNPRDSGNAFILIEHIDHTRGRIVNGTYPAEKLARVGYVYDAEAQVLDTGGRAYEGSVRALMGVSHSLSQDAGEGISSELHEIMSFPASVDGITLREIRADGTVVLSYHDSDIVLAPGERWERIYTDTASSPDYRIKLIRSDSIRNDGIVLSS